MGKADVAVNRWLGDNERFASLYNGVVFGGQQIIKPEELEFLACESQDKIHYAMPVQWICTGCLLWTVTGRLGMH